MTKNSLILALIILLTQAAYAADYIVSSDRPVKAVYVRNEEILTAKPLYTLNNDKENIIISVKKDGKTAILVNRFDEEIILDVRIKDGEMKIKNDKGFDYFPIDNPPEGLEILPPPSPDTSAKTEG